MKVFTSVVSRYVPLALLLFGQCLSAATYYVSPGGSDSNPGTSSQPYRTVAKGVSVARAGDTILLGDGTYGNEGHISSGNGDAAPVEVYSAGTSSAWITLKAQNKGKAILDCGTSYGANLGSGMGCDRYIHVNGSAAYWSFEDLVLTRSATNGINTNEGGSHIRIKGCRFEYIGNWNDSTQYGIDGIGFNSAASDWWIEGNVFHDIGRTTSGSWQLDHGIYAAGTNVTVINNIFYNMTKGFSIQMANGSTNWLIANNTFAFPNATAYSEPGQIMVWESNTNLTIRNNIFYQPNYSGIVAYYATINGCSVDHNLIYGASQIIDYEGTSASCTIGSNQMGADPKLVNASSAPYDFHPQGGGAGIDAGMTISAVNQDMDLMNRPQGAAYDIGAYEFGTQSGPSISGVFPSGITATSAVINWTTNTASSSQVQYGLSGYTSQSALDSTLVTIHSVTLSNLTPATLYHFRVVSQDAAGDVGYSTDYTFITASAGSRSPRRRLVPISPRMSLPTGN